MASSSSMLSQRCKYALRAAVHLAGLSEQEGCARIADIAAAENIPHKFLEAILLDLRKAGLLKSVRGRDGGYRLAKPPEHVSMGDIIRVVEGTIAPIRCASRNRFEPCEDCGNPDECVIRWAMVKARDAMAEVLDRCTLAEAARRRRTLGTPLDFVI
ncbi:RrF2 family transcriptional regulator [Rhodospirillum centenum]|uniref:Rrf2 family protein (Putative transcriptional regulator) n=1 Tax=Rhodospirillum centenum (strain ATCC 51521 / SW) TaxID=414684 RepID=B6IY31_RHOCS|nr:Rrf2 family transcriptional regulator [Rhodospirillum centenum]ACJ01205.1 rrf2 family protein (putative transcriptional regulator) [Rhodospirillum centenum SW]